jgi:molecular chaperone DnaK
MNQLMSRIIGIDLGTSTSEVAYLKEGQPVLIPNLEGDRVTPSAVYVGADGKVKVGAAARSYAVIEPENTVLEVKRLMGSQNTIRLGDCAMQPREVSACILRYLKAAAEQYLGESVTEAVITVPAYFSNEQRVATKEAGELAGFKVERIINEPTAAALAYGLDHMTDKKHVLVYDLGGGTLDVTVLEMFDGVLEVKASCGNNYLGGKDFDEALIKKLTDKFHEEQGVALTEDRKAMARLKEAAEKIKIDLSHNNQALLDLPFITVKDGQPLGIRQKITRVQFEALIGPMVRSTLEQIDTALADAALTPTGIDTILLVGGSTKIPLVKEVLKEKFGKEPLHEVNPDEAVALGAAIQAGIKEGTLSGANDPVIIDVCPYTLGIECVKDLPGLGIPMPGMFDTLIKRNTSIPVTTRRTYQTFGDKQTEAHINVYQGEKPIAKENNLIGEFVAEGIPAAPAGEEKIDIDFSYDINGIIDVGATVVNTGQEARIRIDTRELDLGAEIDVETEWKKSKQAHKEKAIIKKAEKTLLDPKLDPDVKEELTEILYELKYALAKNDQAFIERYDRELTEFLYNLED